MLGDSCWAMPRYRLRGYQCLGREPSALPAKAAEVAALYSGVHSPSCRPTSGEPVPALRWTEKPAEKAEHTADESRPLGVVSERISSPVCMVAHAPIMTESAACRDALLGLDSALGCL